MEPSRKIRRVAAKSKLQLAPVEEDSLVFWTSHHLRPTRVDLRCFRDGSAGDRKPGNTPFSGRPKLIEELAPHIKMGCATAPASTVGSITTAFRFWWRILDELEHIAPVQTVADLSFLHEARQLRASSPAAYTTRFLFYVNLQRRKLELSDLRWQTAANKTPLINLPKHEHVKLIYEVLKQRAWGCLERTRPVASHELGVDWSAPEKHGKWPSTWTFQDRLATYLSVCKQTGRERVTEIELNRALGEVHCDAFDSVKDLAARVNLTSDDIRGFFTLFVLLTGWNPQTALDVDIGSDCVMPHPTSTGLQLVRSWKLRAGTEQIAISQTKRELSPGNILLTLRQKTAGLRAQLITQLRDAVGRDDRAEIARLRAAVRSPWIFDWKGGAISSLTIANFPGYNGRGQKRYLHALIDALNIDRLAKGQPAIPVLSISDLRDAFISFTYEKSGYNWLLAKLAAGHVNAQSTIRYLASTRFERVGAERLVKFNTSLWSEIAERRIVEPAFLKLMVDHGSISEVQRQRWLAHKDRTRLGVGCRDFRNPPEHIAPAHVSGQGCRVTRCTLCPHAVIFDDSVDHLARRLAELIALRHQIPLTSWASSNFSDEMKSLETSLSLFDPKVVEARMTFWSQAIATGSHRPLLEDGAYV
jgi:hypothetical protein